MTPHTPEDVRRAGCDWAMGKIMEKIHELRLMPVVLIAVTPDDQLAILPCGPARHDQILKLIRTAARLIEDGPENTA